MNNFDYQSPESFEQKPQPTFSTSAPSPVYSGGVEVAKARSSQEVQAAVFMAKQFPRDPDLAFSRIMKACQRVSLAEQSMYEYPRGGEKVSGPSIRLAEAIAQNWGNIQSGIEEVEQRDGYSVVEAYAWDLETNNRITNKYIVKHERHTKKGMNRLNDPRDIYETIANMGSRRKRACILAVIPGDIVDAAVDACKSTLKNGGEPLEDRVRKMIVAFEKDFQVSKVQLEKYIGCLSTAFTVNDVIRLRNVYSSLKDGMSKREDHFEMAPAAGVTTNTEKEFQAAQAAKAEQTTLMGGENNAPANKK